MAKGSTGWYREFDEPIALPDGRKLILLRDAASYITALPGEEAAAPEWQAALGSLGRPATKHHLGRRKLKRDSL
jgi:hypothetical protein